MPTEKMPPARQKRPRTKIKPLPRGASQRSEPAPHYGQKLHALVQAVRQGPTPAAYAAEYDLLKEHFDVAYYLTHYPDVARSQLDPIAHYIRIGAKRGHNPTPVFSTRLYKDRYKEVASCGMTPFAHWLTVGIAKGYIAVPFTRFNVLSEMLGSTPNETQEAFVDRHRDVRQRLVSGKLGEMANKAAEIDPLVTLSWPGALQLGVTPFRSMHVISRTSALYSLQRDAGFRRAKAVIVVNRPRWGGARRMEGHVAHALAEKYSEDELLIIASDQGGTMPDGKFPEGARYIDFCAAVGNVNERSRQRLLLEFLRSLRPELVVNVNSRLLWETVSSYGQVLAMSSKLISCFFCNEQTAFGYWTGYPLKRFYPNFDTLSAVFTDSHFLADDLREQYQVPPSQNDKLHVLQAPVDASQPIAAAPPAAPGRRPQVFWSGRFDRQKRVDIVYSLAHSMPHVDFRMWGEPVINGPGLLPSKPSNVQLEGVYKSFADLPLEEADVWLYTSEWDGVPSLLLEVSMTGVPIVGSRVGGTKEILRDDLSWPVDTIEDISAYRTAIKQVISEPEAARERALSLRETLVQERTPDAFDRSVQRMLEQLG